MVVTTKKWVYLFHEGRGEWRDLLGGKGAGLADMTNAGLPVPPGFTITTEACNAYYELGRRLPEGLWEQVIEALQEVERATGKKFGDDNSPLLVSVRSGAKFSMPGMMDTVLNLGLDDETVKGLIRQTDNPRFAYDAYRRFIQMFGKVVLSIDAAHFEEKLEELKHQRGVKEDTELNADDLRLLVEEFKAIVRQLTGKEFPSDPYEQLRMAIQAVFDSWNNKRAIDYRRVNRIPDTLGTACNAQAMVFGNMGFDSATGVAFTRNPSTGEKKLYGEYLPNAQGEDVVAGIRTPKHIEEMANDPYLKDAYQQFLEVAERLERHYKDMQDLEFTIERGKLYMLQTRTGKRTGRAAVKIAVDMVHEGIIDKATAVRRVAPEQLDQLLHPSIDPSAEAEEIAVGLPASPGAVSGEIVLDADDAELLAKEGRKVILVRVETSPDDFHGMVAAQGILTARGGMTSHAAVVARGMGKTCVVGANITVDYGANTLTAGPVVLRRGDWITIDGSTGKVYKGLVPTVPPSLTDEFRTLMSWADEFRRLGVRANADTPRDAAVARDFGAEGIGLARTEHMFFEGDRIDAVRQMIMAEDPEGRRAALAKILPMQRKDFLEIFKVMDGLPVTIRTLDPPLHEFLPKDDAEIRQLAQKLGLPFEKLKARVEALAEFNPMLGWRGCRLGITHPEITEMQARAIFQAAIEATKQGYKVLPEIMIPLVSDVNELTLQKEIIDRVAQEEMAASGITIEYSVGTMIELPRASLTADKIAREAQFFSFGTNDLTQTTFGMSRDDAGKFLPLYIDRKILPEDPFQVLDRDGVGKLIEIGVTLGRKTRPDLKVGICGEHGGEPSSVHFCHQVGLNYVSCSPYRVPIARLAAAQAALEQIEQDK